MLFSSKPTRFYPYRRWLIITAEVVERRDREAEKEHEGIMFVENRKDDDGRLLNNHRLTSLLFYSERDACIACIHFVNVHRWSFVLVGRDFRSIRRVHIASIIVTEKCRSYIFFVASLLACESSRLRCSIIERFKAILRACPPCTSFKKWFLRKGFETLYATFVRGKMIMRIVFLRS